ncbi:hypothetical protein SAY86_013080 [Trapa natans]|uniref:Uncharacterized protein n=1 Tax=Trapa natans TaxID=22666 RepID=A0AAN7LXS3_TRANT|nr:hypothetical protein SAY86_013080 [Trapa natans]
MGLPGATCRSWEEASEQSPSKSIENALSPYTKALVAEKLFKHRDIDVKIAVAPCISEITRISTPEAPYNDDS